MSALPPSAFAAYDLFGYALGKKIVDLGADAFKIALFTSTSNAGTPALVHSVSSPPLYSDLTNEVSNANGYTTGGYSVTPTWSNTAGVETMALTNATWTASGAGITFRFAVLYDDTTKNLIGWIYGDSTPQDVSVAAGNQLVLQINASGAFTLTHTP